MREILGEKFVCTLISEDLKIDRSLYITKPFDKSFQNKFILGILGILASKLLSWFFRYEKNEFDALFPKIRLEEFKNLPIPKATEAQKTEIAEIVDKILTLKKAETSANTLELEREIGRSVYGLYELTAKRLRLW
jgi:adenine-specific DNA-methyltransferase